MKNVLRFVVNKILKIITHILLDIDSTELEKVPQKGPLLAVANHINFLEPAVIITHLDPRPTTGLAKKEAWDNLFHRFLFNLWGGIPLDRDTADFSAFQKAKKALKEGMILAVAPEGTRSEDGRMIRGKPGIALLVSMYDVPIMPMAFYGHEDFNENFKRLKRTPMKIRVGDLFRIDFNGQKKDKAVIQAVTDAIMLEVTKLLPDAYHGVYAQGNFEQGDYIEYLN